LSEGHDAHDETEDRAEHLPGEISPHQDRSHDYDTPVSDAEKNNEGQNEPWSRGSKITEHHDGEAVQSKSAGRETPPVVPVAQPAETEAAKDRKDWKRTREKTGYGSAHEENYCVVGAAYTVKGNLFEISRETNWRIFLIESE
jgi:hypothetical protein